MSLPVTSLQTTWRCGATVAVIAIAVTAPRSLRAESESAAGLTAEYNRLVTQYSADMAHMSHVAYARQWSGLGDLARLWRPERPPSGLLLFVAPDEYSLPLPPGEGRGEGALSASSVAPSDKPVDSASAPQSEPTLAPADPNHPHPNPLPKGEGTRAAEPGKPTDSGDSTGPWRDQFSELRRAQADSLFRLAQRAADAGQRSLAFAWATEAVRENPDHADARRVLGYEKYGSQWLTQYARQMAEAGKTWHVKYGWIAPADLPRYEAGERLNHGQWITAEDDTRRHSSLDDGWQVRTDHFLVTTNHSLEAASELASRLERLHQVWRQLFAGFYLSEREVRELFAGQRNARKQGQPFRVFYHRNRNEYEAALVRRQPRIAETIGIYFDVNRESHFFAGEDQDAGTLYHEAVHQLFQESDAAARRVGEGTNFWIIEGIATYFETLREHDDSSGGQYYTIGEGSAGRLPAARKRLLKDGYYVPLARFVRLGKSDLQRRPDLAQLYSQAAGLATFLMDADEGRYREPLIRYLVSVYAGRDDPRTLARAVGCSYRELDVKYRQFVESLP
jgi:hypothetical protein